MTPSGKGYSFLTILLIFTSKAETVFLNEMDRCPSNICFFLAINCTVEILDVPVLIILEFVIGTD